MLPWRSLHTLISSEDFFGAGERVLLFSLGGFLWL